MKFQNPTRIIFSSGSVHKQGEIVEELHSARSFLITDVFAREALKLIFGSLDEANKGIDGNTEARENLM